MNIFCPVLFFYYPQKSQSTHLLNLALCTLFLKKANTYRHYNSYPCLLTHTLPLSTPQDFLQMAKNAEYIAVRIST